MVARVWRRHRQPLQASLRRHGVACAPADGVQRIRARVGERLGLLRFPPALETQYLQDKATERLKMIRLSMVLVVVLFDGMLVSDWLMIPDQFRMALLLRVVVFTPIAVLWMLSLK